MKLPVMPPVSPMLAKAVHALPDRDDLFFEPKWDGFRCIVFRDGQDVVLGSRNERPLTRYFPELIQPIRDQFPDRCVVDGELVIAGDAGLDFDALQQRIHPAESRVNLLAEKTPASFVAFDLLALGDRPLVDEPLSARRAALESSFGSLRAPLHLTPMTTDRSVATDWFVRFEGAGLDGVMAKPSGGTYQQLKRVQFKVKHKRTADCVVGGYRMHKRGDGAGSLLLGLYDDDGRLHHVGVAASFSAKARKEILAHVRPFEARASEDHPWREWIEWGERARASGHDRPGGFSRWNADKDLSFVPLRAELVAEVAYEHLQNGRFRHGGHLIRWRADRSPSSCTFAQLEEVPPFELAQIFGGS